MIAACRHNAMPLICGYATTWLTYSHGGQLFRYERDGVTSLLIDEVKALVGHDGQQEIGDVASGTLKLAVDDIGLQAWISPPSTAFGDRIVTAVRTGQLSGLSIGADVDSVSGGCIQRRVIDRLLEVSLTDCPRNKTTCCIVAEDYQRHLHASLCAPSVNPQEQLRMLERRNWRQSGDAALADYYGRQIAMRRLCKLAAHNAKYSGRTQRIVTHLV